MEDGILILNKPAGWTSHDCVAICRRMLRLKGVGKVGHGGTLDPMAEGLLPLFIGQATRLMEYMDLDYKTYECRARLGVRTDTQDVWGETIEELPFDNIKEDEVREALRSFEGIIEQIPPAYSAVRIDGKRLYEYARAGKTPLEDVPKRKVHISMLRAGEIDMDEGIVGFTVKCSKGTYVRTICDDLGKILGCGASMEYLKRTEVGDLDLSGSISPEEIKRMDEDSVEKILGGMILPPDTPLKKFGAIRLSPERSDYFRRGNSTAWVNVRVIREPDIPVDAISGSVPKNARGRSYDSLYCIYEEGSGQFLGTGFEDRRERLLKADKVFAGK